MRRFDGLKYELLNNAFMTHPKQNLHFNLRAKFKNIFEKAQYGIDKGPNNLTAGTLAVELYSGQD